MTENIENIGKALLALQKMEEIIVEEINAADPLGILKNKLNGENYEKEIEDIVIRLPEIKTFLDLSELMCAIFIYHNDLESSKPSSKFLEPSVKICKRIAEITE